MGEWERSAAVMDSLDNARRAPTFPVVCDDAARGLQQRLRSRMLQINDARETYREQVQSTAADGIDPQNIGLQMAKLHELEGRLLEERGDKAELLAEKEALLRAFAAPERDGQGESRGEGGATGGTDSFRGGPTGDRARSWRCSWRLTRRRSRRRRPATTWSNACTSSRRAPSRRRCG